MAQRHPDYLRERMPDWRETHPGVEELQVAVMGCVVNGPGESKHADIGISLPGTFEEPVAPVFIDGKLDRTLRGDGLVDEFMEILEDVRRPALPDPRGRLSGEPAPSRRGSEPMHRGRGWPRGPAERPVATHPDGGPGADGPGSRAVPSGVYFAQRDGRSATWVTPTFLFVEPARSRTDR